MAKLALGRGLDALIPTSQKNDKINGSLKTLPLSKIAPNPFQPRRVFDTEKLKELADSLKKQGVLQPILVKRDGDGYILIAGERRFRAAKLVNMESVPALVMNDMDETRMLELALIENIQREDLNPIETARAYKSLLEQCSLTQVQLAERVGKNRASVANTLRLLSLPDNIRQLITEGKLSEGHARALLSVADDGMRDRMAQRILSETMSVRQAEGLARKSKRRKLVVKRKPPGIEEAETFLKHLLGTSVKIIPGLKKGKIEVEYYGDEDLNRLLDLMRRLS
ncbi:MAG: ParB/RepB/Spo0J family partition protein [candidate division Zixibacteria bacterium]|nr:ParB/RepB/Spo0J family partition protein [candidate division Zixibacteria bacterium]